MSNSRYEQLGAASAPSVRCADSKTLVTGTKANRLPTDADEVARRRGRRRRLPGEY